MSTWGEDMGEHANLQNDMGTNVHVSWHRAAVTHGLFSDMVDSLIDKYRYLYDALALI